MNPAKALLKAVAISVFQSANRLRARPHRTIRIMSHMRSGSTLLLHLLLESPEICGLGERNSPYHGENDLALLALKSWREQPAKRWAKYSMDQINHTHLVQSEDLLLHPTVYPIILVREPRGAINSMLEVLGKYYNFDLDDALKYYRERMTTLIRYSTMFRSQGRTLFLTYDDLLNNTQHSLQRLQAYLGLQGQLSDRYSTHDFTAKRGDPSGRISAGMETALWHPRTWNN